MALLRVPTGFRVNYNPTGPNPYLCLSVPKMDPKSYNREYLDP